MRSTTEDPYHIALHCRETPTNTPCPKYEVTRSTPQCDTLEPQKQHGSAVETMEPEPTVGGSLGKVVQPHTSTPCQSLPPADARIPQRSPFGNHARSQLPGSGSPAGPPLFRHISPLERRRDVLENPSRKRVAGRRHVADPACSGVSGADSWPRGRISPGLMTDRASGAAFPSSYKYAFISTTQPLGATADQRQARLALPAEPRSVCAPHTPLLSCQLPPADKGRVAVARTPRGRVPGPRAGSPRGVRN